DLMDVTLNALIRFATMNRLPLKYGLLLFLLIGLASCNLYKEVEVTTVGDLRITEMGKDGIFAEVPLTIHNPNSFRLKLVESDIDLMINRKAMGKVNLAEPLYITRKSTGDYVLKLRTDYENLSPDF